MACAMRRLHSRLVLGAMALLAAGPPPPGGVLGTVNQRTGVSCSREIAYLEGDEADPEKHRLDLYLPNAQKWTGPRPLVIWIHGGGWVMGDKDDAFGLYGRYCRRLAEHGVAAANICYRLSPQVTHPGHIEDVAAAAAWLIEHAADLGVDTKSVFVSGHSAGGHLSALLASDHRWLEKHGIERGAIAGAIPVSGVFDLRLLFALRESDGAAFNRTSSADASPALHADAEDPPFVLIVEEHGGFMRRQTQVMAAALEKAGVENSIITMADTNHLTMMGDFAKDDGILLKATLELIERIGKSRPVSGVESDRE